MLPLSSRPHWKSSGKVIDAHSWRIAELHNKLVVHGIVPRQIYETSRSVIEYSRNENNQYTVKFLGYEQTYTTNNLCVCSQFLKS